MMSDQTDHGVAVTAPYRNQITINVGGDAEDRIQIKTSPSVSTPTPSPRSIQSTTDEISSHSTDDDHAVLAPKQKTSPNGVDNLAFENEHKTSQQQRPLSSFGQNGNGNGNGKGNGTMQEQANGKNEAVNLELVNLNKTPTSNGNRDNGLSPKKKDTSQVEMGNSYNEYFVPVNEHKKYMRERGLRGVDHYGHSLNEPIEGTVDYNSWRKIARGEKLYVTKDKRLKTNWRKRVLWVVGLTLCAAVLLLPILFATGTFDNKPELIESRSNKDKLATAGFFGRGSKTEQNDTYPVTPQPPGSTVPPHPPTTEENIMFVPNTMNGKFKIENHEFLEEYKDHNSPIYQTIAREIEQGIMESLNEYENIHVKVLNLSSGSIVVDYRVTWDDDEVLSDDILSYSLSNYLKDNHNYISSYFVPAETISYTKVTDTCAMKTNEMNCDGGCEFNRVEADFVCTKSSGEVQPEPESSSAEPEPEVSSSSVQPEVEPEPVTIEPSAKQIEIVHDHAHHHHDHHDHDHDDHDPEHATAEPAAKSEPTAESEPTSEPTAEKEPSPETEPSPEKEPAPENEPSSEPNAEVEPEPATAEPSAKQIEIENGHAHHHEHDEHDHEHATAEPAAKSEPSAESEPKSEPTAETEPSPITEPSPETEPSAEKEPTPEKEPSPETEPSPEKEPSPEGEPSTAEPSAKQIDIDSVTSEPISKVEPSPSSEPKDVSAEPSPEIVSEESTAEPSSSSSPESMKKSGKVLSYGGEAIAKLWNEMTETTMTSIERKVDNMDEINKESVETSTIRKQVYTYDFASSENPNAGKEKDQQEHSSNASEQTIMNPLQQMPAVEGSTMRATSSEQPAPVTEDLSDDTPMPTGSYFKVKSVEQRTEVNVMDGNVTPASVEQTSPTIYSTTAPIKLQYEENVHPTIRIVPAATASSDNPTYSVTENISEQSPFLPDNENGDSVLNILHTPHDDDAAAAAEPKAKSLNIDEEDSLENDDAANSISGHDIIPQKKYKLGAMPHLRDNDSTIMKEVADETEKTLADSTETYNMQESRTHNHDNMETTKMHEKHSSEETLETSHVQKGDAVPTTIVPLDDDHNDDSMEMEPMNDMTDLMSMMSGKKSSAELGSSSSTTEESTESLIVEQTTYQARNPMKNMDASSTEVSSTEHSKEEQIVSSSSEASSGEIPLAEPTPSSKVKTASQSSEESELTTIRVEQTVSAVSVTNHTETKNEIITTTSGQKSEITPTAEPSLLLSVSNTDEKTPPLNDMESNVTKSNAMAKSDIETTSENTNMKSSTEFIAMETSSSAKLAESETSPSAELTPSETTLKPSEMPEMTKVSETDLKVIPLHTSRRPDRDDIATKDDSSEESSEEESAESTTGHFLSKATFQPSNKQSVGTSLKSSDKDGNDLTGNDNNNGPENVLNDNDMNVMVNDSFSTPPAPMTPSTHFVGYTRCTAGQFECLNGTSIIDGSACISLSQRCNAIRSCSDGSDEADCEMLGCPGHFQCSDGSCLDRSLVCDRIKHCSDGDDEADELCNNWKCKFDEIQCSENGPCLPAILKCDGVTHCANQADETNCPDTCKNNEFYCSWQHKCIPETFVCDGKIDCSGGEDERLCECPEDHFKCNTGLCVPGHYVCDGKPHCYDLSDDWDCFNLTRAGTSSNNTTATIDDFNQTSTINSDTALQIKKPNGKFAFVCYDNWNFNMSNWICRNFGFARSIAHSSIQFNARNASLVRINDNYQLQDSILTYLNETDSCLDNQIVALECEKYACGNNLTNNENVDEAKQWPSLAVAINEISSVHCTATIVSPRWALASYSCILGKFDISSEVEKTFNWNLLVKRTSSDDNSSDEKNNLKSQLVNIARIFKYPQTKFKHFLYSGDVVLLELEKPLEFGGTVAAACLNSKPIDSANDKCISVGWFLEDDESTRKTYLKRLSAPPLSPETCNATTNYAGSLPDDLICFEDASNDNNTKCQINTDEGAPLLCYSNAKSSWQMKGMLSYRSGCRRHPLPAVYSELTPSIIKWITKTIGNDFMIQR